MVSPCKKEKVYRPSAKRATATQIKTSTRTGKARFSVRRRFLVFIQAAVLLSSFVIGGPVGDLGGAVDLLQEHHPSQLMGEGHAGEGDAGVGPLF